MDQTTIHCLGINHQTAALALREQLGCAPDERERVLAFYTAQRAGPFAAIGELVILSTCNRVELYAAMAGPGDQRAILADFLATTRGVPLQRFASFLYDYADEAAVYHLCRVATGLDSRVLGESQILGQVSAAFLAAQKAGAVGPILTALFQSAQRAGKRARRETAIGAHPASISSLAIGQAAEIVGELRRRRVVVIGLGEMALLALKALAARGVSDITIINRRLAHGVSLTGICAAPVQGFERLAAALVEADVVISATAAPHPVIRAEMVAAAMSQRPERPLVLLDIAVPRDVEPAAGRLANVFLLDVDDLHERLDQALDARQRQAPAVEAIIEQEAAAFAAQRRSLAVAPLITDLRQKAEAIRRRELRRALRQLPDADPATLEQLHLLSHSLVNKLLHEPTIRLKEKAAEERAADYANTLRELFGLGAGGGD
jgi:glutamyl-tRNA reductase